MKALLYKQSLCLARGLVSIPDEDAPEGEEGAEEDGGGAKDPAAAEPKPEGEEAAGDISEKDVADALAQEQLRVWSDPAGDPYERKKALAVMFARLFRQHAAVARKLATVAVVSAP